jgi:hypothetical protein
MNFTTTTKLAVISLAMMLGACSSQVMLTIESEPPGAAVYEGERLYGTTPVTLNFNGDDDFANGGCMGTMPIRVEWNSGAEARLTTINLCASQTTRQAYTFAYPDGFPVDDSAELVANDAVAEPRVLKRRVAPNGQLYYEVSHSPSQQVLHCYSDVNGTRVETNCI